MISTTCSKILKTDLNKTPLNSTVTPWTNLSKKENRLSSPSSASKDQWIPMFLPPCLPKPPTRANLLQPATTSTLSSSSSEKSSSDPILKPEIKLFLKENQPNPKRKRLRKSPSSTRSSRRRIPLIGSLNAPKKLAWKCLRPKAAFTNTWEPSTPHTTSDHCPLSENSLNPATSSTWEKLLRSLIPIPAVMKMIAVMMSTLTTTEDECETEKETYVRASKSA